MALFRKKPVVVEAVQYLGRENYLELKEFVGDALRPFVLDYETTDISIDTLEGTFRVSLGDWIVKGVVGEFYSVKPDIFGRTYERA